MPEEDPQKFSAEHHIGEHSNVPGGEERTTHVPSSVDAMGKDKRRQVVGQTYGPTVRQQVTVWGAVIGTVIVLTIVFLTVVNRVDNREIALDKTAAPWAAAGVEQSAPRPIDYPANGPDPAADPTASAKPSAFGQGEVPPVAPKDER